jgi:hypothetical protein
MPTHRKRPRDFSQAAKLVIDIATGQSRTGPRLPLFQLVEHIHRHN